MGMYAHGHDRVCLTNKASFFRIIVTDMQVDRLVRNLVGLSRLTKDGEPDFGLWAVGSDQQGTGSLTSILEHSGDGGLLVVIGDIRELLVILKQLWTQGQHVVANADNDLVLFTFTSMPSEHKRLNRRRETRYMRSRGTFFSNSPVWPFQVGRMPGSGGSKFGSTAAV